jgi:hypothetical protein
MDEPAARSEGSCSVNDSVHGVPSPKQRPRTACDAVAGGATGTASQRPQAEASMPGRQLPQAKPGWWLAVVCLCATTTPSR